MWNSCTSVFPNTWAWDSKNEIRQTEKEDKKRGVSMERNKVA